MLCSEEFLHDVGLLPALVEVRSHRTFYFHAISGAAPGKTQFEIVIEQLIGV
jgi:hypothetical protein